VAYFTMLQVSNAADSRAALATNGMASLIAFQPKGVPAFFNLVATNFVKSTNGTVLAGKAVTFNFTNGVLGGITAP
jgi:hypothetical protein